tara:strand:- start:1309 stop:1473 length:165 start_codon:yes stop_codon:yes gene_type:complete
MIRLISQRLAANTHVVQMVVAVMVAKPENAVAPAVVTDVAVNQKTVANLTKILS